MKNVFSSLLPGESSEPKIILHFVVYVKISADNRQFLVLKVFGSGDVVGHEFLSLSAFCLWRVLMKYL